MLGAVRRFVSACARVGRALTASLAAGSLALALAAPAPAALPDIALPGLDGDEHVEFTPIETTWGSSAAVTANVGDVNGDGYDDVGSQFSSSGAPHSWNLYVVFSDPTLRLPSVVDPDLPYRGFTVRARGLWYGASAMGDVNRDGLGDFALLAADSVHVVFGKADRAPLDVSDPGRWGFRVDGVQHGVASGYNSSWMNTTITSVGDQNGDGIRDLVVRDFNDVKVVFTPPSPAGKVLNADSLGNGGYTLNAHPEGRVDMFVGALGDQNGDGREDIAVGVESPDHQGAIHAWGVFGGRPGEDVDLRDLAARLRGFEFHADAPRWIDNMTTVADQNGDGKREIAIVDIDNSTHERILFVPYSPANGSRLDYTTAPGARAKPYSGNVIDVGDQDGDGVGDLAWTAYVVRSSEGWRWFTPIGRGFPEIAATLGDMDGDGRREIVVAANDRLGTEGAYVNTFAYDVYYSRPRLEAILNRLAPERLVSDVVRFTGTFANPVHPLAKALGQRAWVQISGGGKSGEHSVALEPADAGERTVSIDVPAATAFGDSGFVSGTTYTYRLVFENGWGFLARGPQQTFTYTAPASGDPGGGSPPDPPEGSPESPPVDPGTGTPPETPLVPGVSSTGTTLADRLFGTPATDRLTGMQGPDRLDGGAGDDLLDGGAGPDRLNGGPGRDRLVGGSGDDRLTGGSGRDKISGGSGADRVKARDGEVDRIDCGSGRDVAFVDRADRVTGCESVRR